MKSLRPFICVTMLIACSVANAMGEGERALNWKFNLDSTSTFMADLDNQRTIIHLQYAILLQQERLRIEAEKTTSLVVRLKKSMITIDNGIKMQTDLKNSCEQKGTQMDDIVDALRELRIGSTTESLKIAALTMTFQQEAQIRGVRAQTVQQLVDICIAKTPEGQTPVPVCRLIFLFNSPESLQFTALSPDYVRDQVMALIEQKSVQVGVCNDINQELQVLAATQTATAQRIKDLEKPK